ncbi:hypothetical protein NB814_00970 [Latilactobacillus curvatus]|uniref:DUF6731 family protein n=1 Tax=Latilactobacillus TaxID=2767885 RepID=UPI00202FA23A|nr:DUF6731 family protein [Latilactobacillus curvatus]MCM0724325.1 hypothetical protein [Latilactobacillus curvatus]
MVKKTAKKTSKKASKKVRFNYFIPHLIDAQNPMDDIKWNMKDFMDYILNHKKNHEELNTAVPLGDEISDLEWNTAFYDDKPDHNIYYFQLSKNRSKDIPSKKKLNQEKKPIELDDDEYIGEFNLVVFDAKYNIVAIQSNFFGLTTKQIEATLSILRQRVKDVMQESEKDNPKGVVLEPIIDPSEISNVKKHKIYRKITVKGSDYNFAAADNYKDNPLNKAITELKKIGGVNFNIELSMSRTSKEKSLDSGSVRAIIDEVLELKDNDDSDVSMHIASKKEENDSIELVDLIEPRLTSTIEMNIENRTTMKSEAIYANFCDQNYLSVNGSTNMRSRASRISGTVEES